MKPVRRLLTLILTAFLILSLAAPLQAGELLDRGVYLQQLTKKNDKGEVFAISYLRVNLSDPKIEIKPVLAKDKLGEVEPLTQMAKRYGAIGAINGTFFNLSKNEPLPLDTVILDGEVLTKNNRQATSLIITRDRQISFDDFLPMVTVRLINQKKIFQISGVNHTLGEGIVLYTPLFGATTKTPPGITEFVVEKNEQGITVIKQMVNGNATIPANGYVLSFQGDKNPFAKYFSVGEPVDIRTSFRDKTELLHLLANGPLLVRDGARPVPINLEGLQGEITGRHPRSALGLTADGRLLLVVVDGRQPNVSVGMTFEELADLMIELGAKEAMALDGGGSAELLANGKIVNSLSEGKERALSNGILVISQIPVYLNDKRLYFVDVPPTIENNRVLVPLRAIFEALNAEIDWNNETKTITATRGKSKISLTIGNKYAKVNGRTVKLDVAPTIVDGRTLVPVRFVAEALGGKVSWDDAAQSVYINIRN